MKARRLVLAAALVAALTTPALADTSYYLNGSSGQDGTGGHDGTTAALAWRTMAYANAQLPAPNTANGHIVIYLAAGQYDVMPNPANAPDNGKRFFFMGSLANRTAARFPNAGTITKDYVSITAVRFISDLTLSSACAFDSVTKCVLEGSLSVYGNGNIVTSNALSGNRVQLGVDLVTRSTRLVFAHNTAASLGRNACTAATDGNAFDLYGVDSSRVSWNTVTTTTPTGVGACFGVSQVNASHGLVLHGVTYTLFHHNHWTHTQRAAGQYVGTYPVRQMQESMYNTFLADSFLAVGTDISLMFGISSYSSSYYQTVKDTRMDSCLVYFKGPGGTVVFEDGMRQDSLSYNSIVSEGAASGALFNLAPSGPAAVGPNLINHNTLVSPRLVVASLYTKNETTTVTNNIFYSLAPIVNEPRSPGGNLTAAVYYGRVSQFDSTFSQHYGTAACDSTTENAATDTHLASNYNLYAYYGSLGVPGAGDRGIEWSKDGYPEQFSRPGAGGLWECKVDQDSLSVYGSPMFYDSTFAGDPLDLRLRPQSAAIGAGSSASDIGAIAFADFAHMIVSPTSFAIQQDVSTTFQVVVTNDGTDDLAVGAIVSSHASVTFSPTTLAVQPGTSEILTLTYTAFGGSPPTAAIVTLTSNSKDNPVQTVTLTFGNGPIGID